MLIKTVEYEIPKNGDCINCEAEFKVNDCNSVCCAFGEWISDYIQCQACKGYIKEQTQCMRCIHQGDYPDWECNIGNDPKTCEEWSE